MNFVDAQNRLFQKYCELFKEVYQWFLFTTLKLVFITLFINLHIVQLWLKNRHTPKCFIAILINHQ